MFGIPREQLRLSRISLAAFCLSLAALGGAYHIARRPETSDYVPPLVLGKGHLTPVPQPSDTGSAEGGQVAGQTTEKLKIPILMYHHVGRLPKEPTALDYDLTVSPEEFSAQLEYFRSKGYRSVSLSQVIEAVENKGVLPEKPIVFTFDDGWKDVFENAVPALKQHGFTGSFAVATKLLGRPGYGVWEDVLSAQVEGMEIISHSENHLDLTDRKYSPEDRSREIAGAKRELEDRIKKPVGVYVYPYGKYDQRLIELVKESGFRMGLTTKYGQTVSVDSLFVTPRVRVHGGAEGLNKLKKIFEPTTGISFSPSNR